MNSKLILGGTMLIAISLILLISGGVKTSETDKKSMQDAQTNLEITIYEGLGLVKEIRGVNLSKGVNSVKFMDVPSQMDPTSLRIKDLNNKAYIIEQNYDYDLISLDKLLQKYLDKNVTFVLENRTITGKLLVASSRNPILETDEGIIIINEPIKNIKFSGIPEGLATKPTLSILMESKTAEKHSIEFDYLTNGMTWYSNYVCVLDKNDKKMDLNGWITIDNQAGTTYKDAKLKVVAGDIHRVREKEAVLYFTTPKVEGGGKTPEVKEESLFEYHMYTIPTKTTLKNNQQKQISFMNAYDANCDKIFVYDPQSSSKVNVKVKFKNSKNNNLGIPLPKGKVRLYKEDSEGKLQFLGEDQIDHTPEDEDVFLYVGDAFDVVAEKTEIDRKDGHCESEVEYEVNIRNHKKEDVEVYVIEHPWYGNWEVLKENFKHDKESTTKISWNIKIEAKGNETLTYRVLYKNPWCR